MKASLTVLTSGVFFTFFAGTYVAAESTDDTLKEKASLHKTCDRENQAVTALISTIQGDNAVSPEVGKYHTVQAVVTGKRSSGYFIQEEPSDSDHNAQTSEGLFIEGKTSAPIGNLIRVSGIIKELGDMTVMQPDTAAINCGTTEDISPIPLSIPFEVDLESLEGMSVEINKATVTSIANLWRSGELVVSDGIKRQPTDVAAPFTQEYVHAESQAKQNLLVIEDNNDNPNPASLSFYPSFSYQQSIRIGDTVSTSGPLLNIDGRFRINPSAPISVASSRQGSPTFEKGNLSIATFNVLNYFNGLTTDDGNTTFDYKANRGAKDETAFLLQQQRIVSAILAMDADVVGLMEIENDGFSGSSAIATLTNTLNSALSKDKRYHFIKALNAQGIGTDAITVGLLYREAVVSPTDEPRIVAMPEQKMESGKLARMRPSLIQAFMHKASKKAFVVSVNHFKSKGSKCAEDIAEQISPQDAVQGSCNALRVSAALTLGDALDDPSLPERKIILGDLNAYSAEDPVAVLTDYTSKKRGYTIKTAINTKRNNGHSIPVMKNFGYHNLAEIFDEDGFSYWYYGSQQVGSLDHVLTSSALLEEAIDGTHWNINSAEPYQLQYNQALGYFGTDKGYEFSDVGPYRSSDHDPFIASFKF